MATGKNFAFKIAAKPWLLLTVYRELVIALSDILLPTSYDVLFGHSTCVRDRQTTGQAGRRHIVPKAQPNGRPKISVKMETISYAYIINTSW